MWNPHGLIMSLLCSLLDEGFILIINVKTLNELINIQTFLLGWFGFFVFYSVSCWVRLMISF